MWQTAVWYKNRDNWSSNYQAASSPLASDAVAGQFSAFWGLTPRVIVASLPGLRPTSDPAPLSAFASAVISTLFPTLPDLFNDLHFLLIGAVFALDRRKPDPDNLFLASFTTRHQDTLVLKRTKDVTFILFWVQHIPAWFLLLTRVVSILLRFSLSLGR